MKTNQRIASWFVLLALFIFNAQLPTAFAQGTTAFTYQGRLNDGANPANGIYDLRFTVCDAVTNGNAVSCVLTNAAMPVSNGLFTVTLDCGPGIFTGENRWLDIAVRTNGASVFTTLVPRQPLTPAPYALYTPSAGVAATASNATTASNFSGSLAGNVTGTQSATVVASVGGQTAANVAGGASLANAATSANTANTLVKRDASGNFSATTITGNLSGNATTAATANNFSGSLAGDVTGPQGATVVAGVGGQSAVNVASGVSAANAATSANTPGAIIKRDASGNFSAGAITAASVSGDGSGLNNLNGAHLVSGSVGNAQLAANAVQTVNIAAGAVGAGQLTPGAAASNLLAGGQSPVPSGSLILCASNNAATLQNAGYVQVAPVTFGDSWALIPSAGAPSPRIDHLAVWTGREVLIWGGYDGSTWHRDGARYNPFTGTWSSINTTNSPLAASFAVWTGQEMLVWGGILNAPARYNPTNDTWTLISTNGAPTNGFYYGSAVWSGTEMLLWGGQTGNNPPVNTGGRYNPATDTWAPITTTGAPSARAGHTAIWTGTEMIIWGGYYTTTYYNNGARYNPLTDTWTNITLTGAPSNREGHAAVWTGSEMIVWGGYNGSYLATGGRYNPATDTWRATSTVGAPGVRGWFFNLSNVAAWTGTEMVFWGGYTGTALNSGGRYNPVTDVWTAMTTLGAPSARARDIAVWADTGMVVFGGYNGSSYPAFNDGFTYLPARTFYLYQRP